MSAQATGGADKTAPGPPSPGYLSADHFERIRAFIAARMAPLLDVDQPTGERAGRALTALDVEVIYLAATGGMLADNDTQDPHQREIVRHRALVAWEGLRHIARQWADHPDYLAEFARPSARFDIPPQGGADGRSGGPLPRPPLRGGRWRREAMAVSATLCLALAALAAWLPYDLGWEVYVFGVGAVLTGLLQGGILLADRQPHRKGKA